MKLVSGLRPMPPRDSQQAHRAATPLELLFDLVSVIAIASAAGGLHHGIAEGHWIDAVGGFVAVFFPIWWAWMNYTWFASAYDNDDTLFRLLTMVIMSGALTMAAGVAPFLKSADLSLIVAGFIIMRIGMVTLWLRAARHDRERRTTCLTYAAGIALAQLYWIGLLLFSPATKGLFFCFFGLGVLLELMVPAVAERKMTTPWHRHHIIERYGLLNIIVLGETLLAGSMALNKVSGEHVDIAQLRVALTSIVILFAMWSLYFSREEHLSRHDLSSALVWGYGHFLIYLAGAAVGAGFAVQVDVISHHAHISPLTGDYAVAIPVALYLLGLWLFRDLRMLSGMARMVLPIFAALTLAAPIALGLTGVALAAALCVIVRNRLACKDKW